MRERELGFRNGNNQSLIIYCSANYKLFNLFSKWKRCWKDGRNTFFDIERSEVLCYRC